MEAVFLQPAGCSVDYTPAVALVAAQVIQLADGRAAVAQADIAAGVQAAVQVSGNFTVTKLVDQVWIDGAEIFWDHSANAATCIPPLVAGDRDFFIGTAVGDVIAATLVGVVNLNVRASYIIDLHRDGGDTEIVRTVVGSTTVVIPHVIQRGGTLDMNLGLTAEAQKLDWMSRRSFALSSNPIFESVVTVVTTCDADVGDLSVGIVNGTHASDADAITESVLFHFDLGADLNIDAESDDGTTEVAATDTTVDFVEGTPVFLCIDGRDPSNMKYYINGVEVLSATANLGKINAATGPLKAIVHLEKSANDSPGRVQVDMLRVRTSEQ